MKQSVLCVRASKFDNNKIREYEESMSKQAMVNDTYGIYDSRCNILWQ